MQAEELIGDIYETALAPERLPGVLGRIDAMLHSDACHFFSQENGRPGQISIVTRDWISERALRDYYQHYVKLDPRKRYMEGRPVGLVLQCADFYDDRYVARSEFYQDFLIPNGARYIAGTCLYADESRQIYVAFNHFARRGAFTADEMRRLEWLTPHLVRSSNLMMRNAKLSQALAAGEAALAALGTGLVAIDGRAAVVYANRFAERWLLPEWSDLFAGASVRAGSPLSSLVEQVRGARCARSLRKHSAALGRELVLTALPYPRDDGTARQTILAHARPEVLLIVSPGKAGTVASAQQMADLFGLSQAEARLAQALAAGQGTDAYADANGISINTVRTQIRALLDKTGEKRLQDLVRMLAMLPGFGQ